MKKGDVVKFITPLDAYEAKDRYRLIEDPDGDRVLVEGLVDMPIRPTRILRINEIEKTSECECV